MQAALKSTVSDERRKVIGPRRYEMLGTLSEEQRFALRQCEQFGMQLQFVRLPMFCDPLPVLKDRDSGKFALMERDGTLNHEHGLTIRPD